MSLFDLKGDLIFGGESDKIESLYQLNRLDWKETGKQRIVSILKNRTSKLSPIVNFDQSVYEQSRYSKQLVQVERDMNSDLYALSFYKTEFALENYTIYPRMEVINVYNMFIERKFCHIFAPKTKFAVAAKEIYLKRYR